MENPVHEYNRYSWMKVQSKWNQHNCPRNMIKAFPVSEKKNQPSVCIQALDKISNFKRKPIARQPIKFFKLKIILWTLKKKQTQN